MSTLRTNSLSGPVTSNWAIDVKSGSYLYSPGMILQTVYIRTDAQGIFAAPVTGDGTAITNLNITITPKRSDSLLLCTWMLNAEISTNVVLLVHRDGSLVTTAGYESYNSVAGNVRYSGLLSSFHDNDNASTLSNHFIQFIVPALSTSSSTFAPAVRSSGGTAASAYLNRTFTSTGADAYEVTVSSGMIQEIAQ